MASDRSLTDDGSDATRPSHEERIEAARSVVYEDGELIDADALEDALDAHGVDVGTAEDGGTEYRNVPRELPLSACHLAVDLREDPAAFLAE